MQKLRKRSLSKRMDETMSSILSNHCANISIISQRFSADDRKQGSGDSGFCSRAIIIR